MADPLKPKQRSQVKTALQTLKGSMGRLRATAGSAPVSGSEMQLIRDALEVLERLGYDPFESREPTCRTETMAPASGAQIASIENSFAESGSDSGRLAILQLAARTHAFSTRQIKRLLGALAEEKTRADALIVLHPRLTDPKNFHRLMGVLSDADEIKRVVDGTTPIKPF